MLQIITLRPMRKRIVQNVFILVKIMANHQSPAPAWLAALRRTVYLAAVFPAIFALPAYSAGVGGKELESRIAACPDTRDNLLLAPILGSIAAATASNLAGAAVDSIVNYLTQVRAATSQASLVLEGQEVSALFGGNNCFYVYLPTPSLSDYLKNSPDWEARKGITADFVNQIATSNLTKFFAVLSFAKPINLVDSSSSGKSYFRPEVEMWHFSGFIDSGCPLFRSCNKRDVVVAMELSFPRAADSDSKKVRSIPLAVGMSGTTAPEVGIALGKRSSLSWFSLDTSLPSISNLIFSITETSRPGALANAIGSAITQNKAAIQQTAERLVYISPETRSDLQRVAFDEYSNYVDLYNKAKAASTADMNDPNSRNNYAILREQMRTQLQRAKAAWSIAGVGTTFSELPPLPALP
jgi:hypothetical protein